MSDYADGIVERAMQHKLVLDDAGQPDITIVVGNVVFGRCSQGCSVSIGVGSILRPDEAETRHRLYFAVTETTEFESRLREFPSPAMRPGLIATTDPQTEEEIGRFK